MKRNSVFVLLAIITTIAFSSCVVTPSSRPHDHKGPPPKEHKGPKDNKDQKGTSVKINPSSTTVQAGRSIQFKAVVTGGKNNVTWRISGAQSSRTNISSNGLLSVAPNESARSITVIATSVSDPSKSARANVSVRKIDDDKKDKHIDIGPGKGKGNDKKPPPPPKGKGPGKK